MASILPLLKATKMLAGTMPMTMSSIVVELDAPLASAREMTSR